MLSEVYLLGSCYSSSSEGSYVGVVMLLSHCTVISLFIWLIMNNQHKCVILYIIMSVTLLFSTLFFFFFTEWGVKMNNCKINIWVVVVP